MSLKFRNLNRYFNMIKKKIKTIFVGKVGVHEKYIKRALEKKEDLFLEHGEETMTIPYAEIKKLGKVGKETFLDKFNREFYKLWYFEWKPQTKQDELF